MSDLPKLTIRNSSLAAFKSKIWLNDIEISSWCQRVTLDLQLKEANIVTLRMMASEVDVQMDESVVDLQISQPVPTEEKPGVVDESGFTDRFKHSSPVD